MHWHYTIGHHFLIIDKIGALIPYGGAKNDPLEPNEKQGIWFSTEPFWEPTAQKWDLVGKLLGMQGTYEKGGGLIRIGIEPNTVKLVSFNRYAKTISAIRADGMRLRARLQGGNCKRHFVTYARVPCEQWAAVERYDGQKWVREEKFAAASVSIKREV